MNRSSRLDSISISPALFILYFDEMVLIFTLLISLMVMSENEALMLPERNEVIVASQKERLRLHFLPGTSAFSDPFDRVSSKLPLFFSMNTSPYLFSTRRFMYSGT